MRFGSNGFFSTKIGKIVLTEANKIKRNFLHDDDLLVAIKRCEFCWKSNKTGIGPSLVDLLKFA